MVYGNILSLTMYTFLLLFVAITTGSPLLYLISIINIILLIYQYSKQKTKSRQNYVETEKVIKTNDEVDTIKEKAKYNIETKYKNSNISEEEKKDLIWEEFMRLMTERK